MAGPICGGIVALAINGINSMALSVLERRLDALSRRDKTSAAHTHLQVWYEFLVRPTCPPSKQAFIRPGVLSSSTTAYVEAQIADFEDAANMNDLTCTFTNAYWYLPLILCFDSNWVQYAGNPAYASYWDYQFNNVLCEECETAGEAEQCIDALMNGSEAWYRYRFPLWGVVLRNNGQTGIPAAIQPIDAINRGGSYLYRDCRARTQLFE